MELIFQQSSPYRFVPYNNEPGAEMEKLHLYYCKRSLNVNKHASDSAVIGSWVDTLCRIIYGLQ